MVTKTKEQLGSRTQNAALRVCESAIVVVVVDDYDVANMAPLHCIVPVKHGTRSLVCLLIAALADRNPMQ